VQIPLVFVLAVTLATPALAQGRPVVLRDAGAIQSALDATPTPAGRRSRATFATKTASRQTSASAPTAAPWPKRHAVLLGGATGFIAGFAIGVKTCRYPTAEGNSCDDYTYPANAQLLGAFTIGGVGAAIGAGVGAIIRAIR
jgi:hypothetical protein